MINDITNHVSRNPNSSRHLRFFRLPAASFLGGLAQLLNYHPVDLGLGLAVVAAVILDGGLDVSVQVASHDAFCFGETLDDTVYPLQGCLWFAIQNEFGQNGWTKEFSVLRNGLKIL